MDANRAFLLVHQKGEYVFKQGSGCGLCVPSLYKAWGDSVYISSPYLACQTLGMLCLDWID